jgi:hypothetical protein
LKIKGCGNGWHPFFVCALSIAARLAGLPEIPFDKLFFVQGSKSGRISSPPHPLECTGEKYGKTGYRFLCPLL